MTLSVFSWNLFKRHISSFVFLFGSQPQIWLAAQL
jgi:hypothetical protein